jgi:RNA polymerase sigma factor (sigma-70 family)
MRDIRQRLVAVIEQERDRYIAFVRRKAMDLSEMDAEDLVADVFFALWNQEKLVASVDNLLAYLYTAITHRLIDLRRRRRPTVSLDAHEAGQAALSELLPAPHANPEELWAQRELRERLAAALAQLPPKQRAVWVATEIAGHTFAELADQWDEPLGTLLARKHRAMKTLQALLNERQA